MEPAEHEGSDFASDPSFEGLSAQARDHVAKFIALLIETARQASAGSQADLKSLANLRVPDGRDAVLREFITQVTPSAVNPDIWDHWLKGEAAPSVGPDLVRTVPKRQGKTKTAGRNGARRQKAQGKLEKAEAALAAATKKRDEAKAELEVDEARDAALIQWMVAQDLIAILKPVFAMGPAWTVMRAISAHLPEEIFSDRNRSIDITKLPAIRAQAVVERTSETERITSILDMWGEDLDFVDLLRGAILGVVESYEAFDIRTAPRSKRRGDANSFSATAADDMNAVLDSLVRKPPRQ